MQTDDPSIPTRESLLVRLKSWEDHESWRTFFETYWHLIYSVGIKSGLSDAEAQDVVQETIIALGKALPDFKYDKARGSFKGFLLKTARWRIIDQKRKRSRGLSLDQMEAENTAELPSDEPSAPAELETLWDAEWDQHIAQAATKRVKETKNAQHYQLYHMAVVLKMPVAEIARTMQVPRHQVYLATSRIRRALKKELASISAGP